MCVLNQITVQSLDSAIDALSAQAIVNINDQVITWDSEDEIPGLIDSEEDDEFGVEEDGNLIYFRPEMDESFFDEIEGVPLQLAEVHISDSEEKWSEIIENATMSEHDVDSPVVCHWALEPIKPSHSKKFESFGKLAKKKKKNKNKYIKVERLEWEELVEFYNTFSHKVLEKSKIKLYSAVPAPFVRPVGMLNSKFKTVAERLKEQSGMDIIEFGRALWTCKTRRSIGIFDQEWVNDSMQHVNENRRLAIKLFAYFCEFSPLEFIEFVRGPDFVRLIDTYGYQYNDDVVECMYSLLYHHLYEPEVRYEEEMFSLPSLNVDMGSDTKSYFDNFLKNVNDTATGMKDATDATTEKVTSFFAEMYKSMEIKTDGLSHKVEKLIDSLSSLSFSFDIGKTIDSLANSRVIGTFKNMFAGLKDFIKTPQGAFMLVCVFDMIVIVCLKKYFDLTQTQIILICSAINMVIPHAAPVFNSSVTAFMKLFRQLVWYTEDSIEDKLTEEVDGKAIIIKNILAVMLGVLVGESFAQKDDLIDGFFMVSGVFDRTKRGVETTMEFIFSMVSEFLTYIGGKLNIDTLKHWGVKFPRLEEIADEVADVVTKMKTTNERMNSTVNDKLMAFDRELRSMIFHEMRHDPKNAVYRQEAMALLSEISKITTLTCKGTGAKGGPRIEPVLVAFIGMRGTGKSLLNETMIYDVTPRTLSEERLNNFEKRASDELFTVQAGMEHWEGYNGQSAIRIDDILQLKDAAGMPNTNVLNVINMHNTSPFFPTYASIDFKGMYEFQGRIIYVTDNNMKASDNVLKSINCPAAFARRIDICVLVVPKDEFCEKNQHGEIPQNVTQRTMIKEKLIEVMSKKNDEEIKTLHDLYLYDWGKGQILSGPYNYNDVRDKIVTTYKMKEVIGTGLMTKLNNISTRAIAARRAELKKNYEDAKLGIRVKGGDPITEEQREKLVAAAIELNDEEDFELKMLELEPDDDVEPFDLGLTEQTLTLGNEDPLAVLGLPDDFELNDKSDLEALDAAYRRSAMLAHPDKGGSQDAMVKVNWAYQMLYNYSNYQQFKFLKYSMGTAGWSIWKDIVNLRDAMLDPRWKLPIPDGERIASIKELWKYMKYGRADYDHNVAPDEEVMQHIADRTCTTINDVKGWFVFQRFDSDTPIGDMLREYSRYLKEKLNKVLDHTMSIIGAIKKSIVDVVSNKKFLLGAGSVLALGACLWKYVQSTMEEQTERAHRTKSKKTQKYKPKVVNVAKKAEESITTTQAVMDMRNAIANNLMWFSMVENGPVQGWILFFKKKYSVNVNHMFGKFKEGGVKYIWMHSSDGVYRKRINVEEMMLEDANNICSVSESDGTVKNEDLGYTHWDQLERDMRDITGHFNHKSTAEDTVAHNTHYGCLLVPELKMVDGVKRVVSWSFPPGFANPITNEKYGSADWEARDAISYTVNTSAGYCGLPWIVNDTRANRPFIASIHCAGGGGRGLGLCTYVEDFKAAEDVFDPIRKAEETAINYQLLLPNGWRILREVPFERVNSKSKLRKTVLFNAWSKCDKRPALLHPIRIEVDGVVHDIDPWFNARVPYGVEKAKYNQQLINDIADFYAKMIISKSNHKYPWESRLLSFEEAVKGVPGIMKGLPRNTSAGYPWSKISKKKFGFFGHDGEYEFVSEEFHLLLEAVKKQIEQLKKGVLPEWVYAQFLKDELRSKAKVEAGKTRLVMGSPIDKTIVSSIYFKDFYRWMQDNRIFNGVAIGINPYSAEWEILARYLLQNGDALIAGDFSNWDGNQPEEFDEGFLRVVEAYYYNSSAEERSIRKLIIKDVGKSKHLVTLADKSFIATVEGIEPSGDLSTGMKNSINNNLRSAYCRAHMILKEKGYSGHWDYDPSVLSMNEVFLDLYVALGDDHVLSVHESHRSFMTERTYGAAMAELNFGYTDANKNKELFDGLKSIYDVSFLKRKWLKIKEFPEHTFAPLELVVILEMAYWLEQGCPAGTIEDVVDTAAKELSAHGCEVYREHAVVMSRIVRERLGYKSLLLPASEDEAEVRVAWQRAIAAYRSLEVEYL